MYSILKQVIEEQGYVLGEMLERINTFSARGKITVDEHEELIELARANARAEDEVDLYAKVVELEQLVKALQEEVELLKQVGEEPVEPEEPTDPEPEEPTDPETPEDGGGGDEETPIAITILPKGKEEGVCSIMDVTRNGGTDEMLRLIILYDGVEITGTQVADGGMTEIVLLNPIDNFDGNKVSVTSEYNISLTVLPFELSSIETPEGDGTTTE